MIGTGGRGNSLIRTFQREKDVVAVRDVDDRHLDNGRMTAEKGGIHLSPGVACLRDRSFVRREKMPGRRY